MLAFIIYFYFFNFLLSYLYILRSIKMTTTGLQTSMGGMPSMFALKSSDDELAPINDGMARMHFQQVPPTRDVTTSNFTNGAIRFRYECSGTKWWLPSRTYIRTRVKITGNNGQNPPTRNEGIAPNMDMMPGMFQSGEFRINDKTVSRVADFMGQVDALQNRLYKSKSWLESVGESTNWWQPDQAIRQQEIASDGALVKNEVPAVQGGTRVDRGDAGFYGATGVNTNSASYNAANGEIVFAQGANGAPLPVITSAWKVGDAFVWNDPTQAAGVLNVQLKVVSIKNGTTIVVESGIAADIDGTTGGGAGNDETLSFYKIPEAVIANAEASRQASTFETTWCPPLSIFNVPHALPGGRYELVLNPQTAESFKKRAIESVLGQASLVPQQGSVKDNGAFNVEITDMYLYVGQVDGPRVDNLTYLLDLEQLRAQAEKIDTDSFGQKNFDVSPSTTHLTVAYQDVRAGEHTAISVTKFKSYEDSLTPSAQQELKLNRLFINYAGVNRPQPDADPSFDTTIDNTIQRYTETLMNSDSYWDCGGSETIEEFHDRGSYYHFKWPRDSSDRSTRVNVHQGFVNGTDIKQMRMFLFDTSRQVCQIRIQDSRVASVELQDA